MDVLDFAGKVLEYGMAVLGVGGVFYSVKKAAGVKVTEPQALEVRNAVPTDDPHLQTWAEARRLFETQSESWAKQVELMERRITAQTERLDRQDARLAQQDQRIDQLEHELTESRHRTWTWEWWHARELTPNWEQWRQRAEVPPPPIDTPAEPE